MKVDTRELLECQEPSPFQSEGDLHLPISRGKDHMTHEDGKGAIKQKSAQSLLGDWNSPHRQRGHGKASFRGKNNTFALLHAPVQDIRDMNGAKEPLSVPSAGSVGRQKIATPGKKGRRCCRLVKDYS